MTFCGDCGEELVGAVCPGCGKVQLPVVDTESGPKEFDPDEMTLEELQAIPLDDWPVYGRGAGEEVFTKIDRSGPGRRAMLILTGTMILMVAILLVGLYFLWPVLTDGIALDQTLTDEERLTGSWRTSSDLELVLLQDGRGVMSVITINQGTYLGSIAWEIENPGEIVIWLDGGKITCEYELSDDNDTLWLYWSPTATVYRRV